MFRDRERKERIFLDREIFFPDGEIHRLKLITII